MSTSPGKDFGPIADDYVFFETHATEAEQDARAYTQQLAAAVPAHGPIRLLDFGCGSGSFTARLLEQLRWPPERLQLTLIEPVESVRRLALPRLTAFTTAAITDASSLPADAVGCFDVVFSNHVLYYVPDLKGQLARLIGALDRDGVFLTAIASRANALMAIWFEAFALIDREPPYHAAEDVEQALRELGVAFGKEAVGYELNFADTEENRLRILRFLLAEYLGQMPLRPLLDHFDRYQRDGRINIRTASEHFMVRPA
ncbi:MAG: methyltransferase domain-containing protein [Planctomycetia bacterium]|nr:methyltransferase domain-containing protein [Planctomycetia bacterium]